MEFIRFIARSYVIFVCVTGYVFGQLFFADFDWDTSIIAVCGITSAVLWNENNMHRNKTSIIIAITAFIALISCIYEIYYYYKYLDIPGNNFAWSFRAPLYIVFVLIFVTSLKHLTRRSSRDRRTAAAP